MFWVVLEFLLGCETVHTDLESHFLLVETRGSIGLRLSRLEVDDRDPRWLIEPDYVDRSGNQHILLRNQGFELAFGLEFQLLKFVSVHAHVFTHNLDRPLPHVLSRIAGGVAQVKEATLNQALYRSGQGCRIAGKLCPFLRIRMDFPEEVMQAAAIAKCLIDSRCEAQHLAEIEVVRTL